jgi:zinc protease
MDLEDLNANPRSRITDGASLVLAYALTTSIASCAPTTIPSLEPLVVSRAVLANGLRVLVHTDPDVPLVAVSLWYRAGARDEAPGQHGLAHLCEHLMFLGSKRYAGQTGPRIEALGGHAYNGSTSADRTRFVMSVPVRALDEALGIEADRMAYLASALTPANLALARSQVVAELRPYIDDPDTRVRRWLLANTLPTKHPYAHFPLGEIADLEALTLTDVAAWLQRHYTPDNAVLALSGPVRAEDALALARAHFATLATGLPPDALKPPAPPANKQASNLCPVLPGPEDRIFVVWNAPGSRSLDAALLDVLGSVLEARLRERFRSHAQSVVSIDVQSIQYEFLTQLRVSALLPSGADRASVRAAIRSEVATLIATGPHPTETREIASQLAVRLQRDLTRMDNAQGRADLLAHYEMFFDDYTAYATNLTRVARARPEEYKAVAARWLDASRSTELLVQAEGRHVADRMTSAAAR